MTARPSCRPLYMIVRPAVPSRIAGESADRMIVLTAEAASGCFRSELAPMAKPMAASCVLPKLLISLAGGWIAYALRIVEIAPSFSRSMSDRNISSGRTCVAQKSPLVASMIYCLASVVVCLGNAERASPSDRSSEDGPRAGFAAEISTTIHT